MARPTNALIVDDESHARKYVRTILKEVGIETCWEAGDGPEALALWAQHRPELVMLDVNLRVMTGLEVLGQIREQGGTGPVIMLTSENSLKTVGEAARLGASGYILKHSPRDVAVRNLIEALDSAVEPEEGAAENG